MEYLLETKLNSTASLVWRTFLLLVLRWGHVLNLLLTLLWLFWLFVALILFGRVTSLCVLNVFVQFAWSVHTFAGILDGM